MMMIKDNDNNDGDEDNDDNDNNNKYWTSSSRYQPSKYIWRLYTGMQNHSHISQGLTIYGSPGFQDWKKAINLYWLFYQIHKKKHINIRFNLPL